MSLHFHFRSQPPALPFSSTSRYRSGWSALRKAFPEALAVVLLPDQGHLLLPAPQEVEVARARLNVCLRTKLPWHPWAPVPPPNPTPGGARTLCALRQLALLPCRVGLAESVLDWKWSTYLDLMGKKEDPWIDAHRLQLSIGQRGPEFLRQLHNYVCAGEAGERTKKLSETPNREALRHHSLSLADPMRQSPETLESSDWRSLARPPQSKVLLHQRVGG